MNANDGHSLNTVASHRCSTYSDRLKGIVVIRADRLDTLSFLNVA